MTVRTTITVLALCFVLSASAQGVKVRFNQEDYTARPASPVAIQVELDSTIPQGLFSFGVVLVYDPVAGRVVDLDSIVVAPELNFNGVQGPGAIKQIADGAAGVKGTVDVFPAPPLSVSYYTGRLLATFNVMPQTPGDYTLNLKLFNTLGPTEDIFVSGDGAKLDDQISFGSAQLHVIPEPGCLALLIWGGSAIFLKRSLGLLCNLWRSGQG